MNTLEMLSAVLSQAESEKYEILHVTIAGIVLNILVAEQLNQFGGTGWKFVGSDEGIAVFRRSDSE